MNHVPELQQIREALNIGINPQARELNRAYGLAALTRVEAALLELERLAGTGPHLLPDDVVCACLDVTGERKVRLYELCQRCEALMQRDDLAAAEAAG